MRQRLNRIRPDRLKFIRENISEAHDAPSLARKMKQAGLYRTQTELGVITKSIRTVALEMREQLNKERACAILRS